LIKRTCSSLEILICFKSFNDQTCHYQSNLRVGIEDKFIQKGFIYLTQVPLGIVFTSFEHELYPTVEKIHFLSFA
jgi:hypothetical protein